MTTREFWAAEAAKMRDTSAVLGKSVLDAVDDSRKADSKSNEFLRLVERFRTFEDLLRQSEISQEERITILRGIYYGTHWSVDFSVEGSEVRNLAFQQYTGKVFEPKDPRPIIGNDLYRTLFNSAEVTQGTHKFDFGHLIIGLDARNSFRAREIAIPTQGGTGLEISTWLGDIGGACGMLAIKRTTAPKHRAINMFQGSSFGGQVNLEGDIAAFLIARNIKETDDPSGLMINENTYISDLLKAYLPIDERKISDDWKFRCYYFLKIIGAKYNDNYSLLNKNELMTNISAQVLAFGEWYMVNRLRQIGNNGLEKIIDASAYLEGAAREVSEIFINTLIEGTAKTGGPVFAKGLGPEATIKGQPFERYVKLKQTKDWLSEIDKILKN